MLKNLGGDVVVPAEYAVTWRFPKLVSDLPAPSLAITYVQEGAPQAPAPSSPASKYRDLLETIMPEDLLALKVC